MTTTDVTARTILALDLGKYKSVVCAYQRDSALAAFDSITTSRAELPRLIDRRRAALVGSRAALRWRAPQELTEEAHGRTPLLPAGPPHRHQDRLRSRARPGPAATPDLAQDDPEGDGQLRPPVGRVQARLTQEREQGIAMSPQVLSQALVGGVRLGREDQFGQLVSPGSRGPRPGRAG
jgi:hypothetical protein